jgi:hypothetical protein
MSMFPLMMRLRLKLDPIATVPTVVTELAVVMFWLVSTVIAVLPAVETTTLPFAVAIETFEVPFEMDDEDIPETFDMMPPVITTFESATVPFPIPFTVA